jgi:hypothetical protein
VDGGAIYALVDPRDGSIRYVGQSTQLKKRLIHHRHEAKFRDTYKDRWIRTLWNLGLDFDHKVLERVNNECDLDEREKHWISLLSCRSLTNATEGGDRGVLLPGELRERRSESIRATYRNGRVGKGGRPKGYRVRPETKLKISKALMGRLPAKETCEKIRQAHLNRMKLGISNLLKPGHQSHAARRKPKHQFSYASNIRWAKARESLGQGKVGALGPA